VPARLDDGNIVTGYLDPLFPSRQRRPETDFRRGIAFEESKIDQTAPAYRYKSYTRKEILLIKRMRGDFIQKGDRNQIRCEEYNQEGNGDQLKIEIIYLGSWKLDKERVRECSLQRIFPRERRKSML